MLVVSSVYLNEASFVSFRFLSGRWVGFSWLGWLVDRSSWAPSVHTKRISKKLQMKVEFYVPTPRLKLRLVDRLAVA